MQCYVTHSKIKQRKHGLKDPLWNIHTVYIHTYVYSIGSASSFGGRLCPTTKAVYVIVVVQRCTVFSQSTVTNPPPVMLDSFPPKSRFPMAGNCVCKSKANSSCIFKCCSTKQNKTLFRQMFCEVLVDML